MGLFSGVLTMSESLLDRIRELGSPRLYVIQPEDVGLSLPPYTEQGEIQEKGVVGPSDVGKKFIAEINARQEVVGGALGKKATLENVAKQTKISPYEIRESDIGLRVSDTIGGLGAGNYLVKPEDVGSLFYWRSGDLHIETPGQRASRFEKYSPRMRSKHQQARILTRLLEAQKRYKAELDAVNRLLEVEVRRYKALPPEDEAETPVEESME